MRTHCKARRPDLTLEDERKKEINPKPNPNLKVRVIPVIIGCCGGE